VIVFAIPKAVGRIGKTTLVFLILALVHPGEAKPMPAFLSRECRLIVLILALFACPISGADEYWGSRKSNKYHLPSCQSAKRIKPENRIVFKSVKQAREAGYLDCKICKPREVQKGDPHEKQKRLIPNVLDSVHYLRLQ
jgi:hypothetical protein